MSKRDLDQLIEKASHFAEIMMREKGEVAPIWHMITNSGEEMIELTPQIESKDLAIALMKAMFECFRVVRYVHFTEAWVLDYRGDKARKIKDEDLDKIVQEGLSNHPDRTEVVMFQAEDDEAGLITGHREIIRDKGKPHLGPMNFFPTMNASSEGRLVGLLPRKGTLQ
jgi:hypothetical protein